MMTNVCQSYHDPFDFPCYSQLQEAFRTGKLQPGLNIVKEKPVKTFVNNEVGIDAIRKS